MIGKITTGSNFNRLFGYLLKDDKEARILGGDRVFFEPDAKALASQFNWIASARPTTKKPVKHFSIGFAPADRRVDEETKVAISEAVVNGLGYTNNQWVAIAHGRDDPGHDWQHDHDHLHIVVNGIDFNGDRISDSFDKTRLEKILRALEREHGLTAVISSNQCARHRPNTKQLKRYQREAREYSQQQRDTPPEIPIMAMLEAAIVAASSARPTMTSFLGRLQHLGIDVRPYISDRGRKRISYRWGDFKVRGSKLHNGSFPKLISERGIDFDEVRDTPALEAAFQGKPVIMDNERSLSGEEIDQVPADSVVIRRSTLDLDYWLPQPFKALANKPAVAGKAEVRGQRAEGKNSLENQFQVEKLTSIETTSINTAVPSASCLLPSAFLGKEVREVADPKQWQNLQQKLLDHYGIPENISDSLNKANLLKSDEMGEPIWQKRSLLGSKDSHFWFEINDSGARVKKIVVANSPVETISAYLVDRLVNKDNCPCLYLSLDSAEQLNELNLTQFNSIVVNNNDQQLVSDSVSNLVVEKNVSSWQQSWLTHWSEIAKILKSEAINKSSSIERQSSKEKQLEL